MLTPTNSIALPEIPSTESGFYPTRLGLVSLNDCQVMILPKGILGFEDFTQYFIAPLSPSTSSQPSFMILQSLEEPSICFILMPVDTKNDPQAAKVLEDIGDLFKQSNLDIEDVELFVIVSTEKKDEKTTVSVNLRAPIAHHKSSQHAWQVVLDDPNYPIDHKIFEQGEDAPIA